MRSREIAGRYAGALYAVAVEDGTVSEVEAELAGLVEGIREVDQFDRFLTHPLIPRERKMELIGEAFPDLSASVANMVGLLIRNRREGYIELIRDEFLEVRSAAEHLARVRVITATEIDDKERSRLTERLEQALGRSVSLETECEEGLLAGARIEVEGRTIDATIRARLSELRQELER